MNIFSSYAKFLGSTFFGNLVMGKNFYVVSSVYTHLQCMYMYDSCVTQRKCYQCTMGESSMVYPLTCLARFMSPQKTHKQTNKWIRSHHAVQCLGLSVPLEGTQCLCQTHPTRQARNLQGHCLCHYYFGVGKVVSTSSGIRHSQWSCPSQANGSPWQLGI